MTWTTDHIEQHKKHLKLFVDRVQIECEQEWDRVRDELPWFSFPAHLQVKVIPPFMGALARFLVKNPETGDLASVYYDEWGMLGADKQYWEVYVHGETTRFDRDDVVAMTNFIDNQLTRIESVPED